MIIRKVSLLFIFSIYLLTLSGQGNTKKKVYFESLPYLEVVNEQIYQVLDSLILYNKNCIYVVRGKPYYFVVGLYEGKNDSIIISLDSKQYNEIGKQIEIIGFFNYKDNIVVVRRRSSFEIFPFFFKETSEEHNIYYEEHFIYPLHTVLSEYMSIEYIYINGVFILKNKHLCLDPSPYYHRIQTGDTWEKIAKDYGITIEDLIRLNGKKKIMKEPSLKKRLIRVY